MDIFVLERETPQPETLPSKYQLKYLNTTYTHTHTQNDFCGMNSTDPSQCSVHGTTPLCKYILSFVL